uniref:Plant heme peroxidase family profile domain-containing protein n=2 Tax=Oryza sativa subsp. japonica TaxID=39947 RepID=Q10K97_ORYSJ|nr:hypothetical protein [Oryza sativa Japonica Group]ABF96376.1 hypothetical protein LOC_Os03g27430 [Oryza sativa Japonica Group]
MTVLFMRKGSTPRELVALAGAHTVGFSHCGEFAHRLYSFKSARALQSSCTNYRSDPTISIFNDINRIAATALVPSLPPPQLADPRTRLLLPLHEDDLVVELPGLEPEQAVPDLDVEQLWDEGILVSPGAKNGRNLVNRSIWQRKYLASFGDGFLTNPILRRVNWIIPL